LHFSFAHSKKKRSFARERAIKHQGEQELAMEIDHVVALIPYFDCYILFHQLYLTVFFSSMPSNDECLHIVRWKLSDVDVVTQSRSIQLAFSIRNINK
jgi:hypothetical protein